jgi:hypothetical protein
MDTPSPDFPSSFWTAVSQTLQPRNGSSGQLSIGRNGVYLINREENVTIFEVVAWEQFLSAVDNS